MKTAIAFGLKTEAKLEFFRSCITLLSCLKNLVWTTSHQIFFQSMLKSKLTTNAPVVEWYTRKLEVLMPQGLEVRVLSGAPNFGSSGPTL
jgi:hypothetical protein